MGKNDGESKKTQQKKKQQLIEDKTFGLKNKNKSKKVQQLVKSVEKSVLHGGDPKLRRLEEQRKKAKEEAKAHRKAQKDEQDALFGEALLAIQKKKTTDQKAGRTEVIGRDGFDDDNKKSTSRAMKMMYQMDAQEMEDRLKEDPNYVATIEDQIESERQKKIADLQSKGIKGTPITPETFAAWQERKRQRRLMEAKKTVEAEFRKKKGGKGLSVLSGRDLYEYKRDLFDKVEDDDQENDIDYTRSELDGAFLSGPATNGGAMSDLAENVKTDLFLDGDDDDLDDIEDD